MTRISVGVLGATGIVGQQFVARLEGHPWFNAAWLAASERSAGKRYEDAAVWRLPTPIPETARNLLVDECVPGRGPKVVFSALDASVAGDIEEAFARAGHIVLSNARNHRMDPVVPLLVPEVNAEHLSVLDAQRQQKGWSGAIVANPNCSTVVLALALAPLQRFGLISTIVSTMQAVSGAGYPGVSSYDMIGNVVPFIGGEEEKIESETCKILGTEGGSVAHPLVVSAHSNRVAVIDGHTMTVSVRVEAAPGIEDVREAFRTFQGRPQALELPTAPAPPILLRAEPGRPQPRLDVERGGGMAISVGRLRPCSVMSYKFVALGHNTVRGAAGASILNAELMQAELQCMS